MVAFRAAAAALLLLLTASTASAQQESVTVLRASGSAEVASTLLKITSAVEDRVSKPSKVIFRRVSSGSAAIADLTASSSLVDFAMGAGPLTSTQASALTGGAAIQVPWAFHTVSLYINLPENSGVVLNMTACVAAKIFNGAITAWNAPEFKDSNPGLTLTVQSAPAIVVQTLSATDPATLALQAWLTQATASCQGGPLWSASTAFPATSLLSANMTGDVARTAYSIGYALTAQGQAAGLNELAVANKAGAFMVARSTNVSNVVTALAAQMPATLDLSMSGVNSINMAGTNVFPILMVDYLYMPKDWSAKGEKALLMQALAKYAMTTNGQALITGPGVWGLGPTGAIALAVNTTLDSNMILPPSTTPYTLEPAGGSGTALAALSGSISGNRQAQLTNAVADLQVQLAQLKSNLARAGNRVLRGSGSSAMSLVFWKLFDQFRGMASSPVWMSYRAIGSGSGEREMVGKAAESYKSYVDFGASDVPMSSTNYNLLKTAGVTVIQIPICVSPMNFFVNIPKDTIKNTLGGRIKLSACTLAKMFSGAITSWDSADIANDNGGVSLPAKPLTFMYRTGSSGTTAVITQYLTTATANQGCSSAWTLGSANTVAGWASIANAVGTGSTVALLNKLVNTTWSIGYLEAGIGLGDTTGMATEVSVKNKAGTYMTSLESNVPAAASALFQTSAWPTLPTSDFSSVSILDQPGATTWPIASMPMMFLRTDVTNTGDSGALLYAFLRFLLNSGTQASLTTLGLSPLPSDVLTYAVSRALPLLLPDPKSSAWFYELAATAYTGAADNVFSDPTLASTYNVYAISQLQTQTASLSTSVSSSTSLNGLNLTALLNGTQGVATSAAGDLAAQLDDMNNQIKTLQSVAAAGVAFGVFGVLLAIFAACRVFVVSTVSPAGFAAGMQSGQSSSVRRSSKTEGEPGSVKGGSGDLKAQGSGV